VRPDWVGSGRSERIEAAVRRNFFRYVRSGRYTGRPRHVPSTAALAEQLSESADNGTSGSRSVICWSRRITFRGRYVCSWPIVRIQHSTRKQSLRPPRRLPGARRRSARAGPRARGSGPTGGRAGPRRGDHRVGMTTPIRRPGRVPWAQVLAAGSGAAAVGCGLRRARGAEPCRHAATSGRSPCPAWDSTLRQRRGQRATPLAAPPRRNAAATPNPLPRMDVAALRQFRAGATAKTPGVAARSATETLPQRRIPCPAWTLRRCGNFGWGSRRKRRALRRRRRGRGAGA
jgi:hypothetical protein